MPGGYGKIIPKKKPGLGHKICHFAEVSSLTPLHHRLLKRVDGVSHTHTTPDAFPFFRLRFNSLIYELSALWADFLQPADLTVHKMEIPILSRYFILYQWMIAK